VIPFRPESDPRLARAWVGEQGVRLGGLTSAGTRGGVVRLGPVTFPEARTYTLHFGFDPATGPLDSARWVGRRGRVYLRLEHFLLFDGSAGLVGHG
jgi:hypothetical protein